MIISIMLGGEAGFNDQAGYICNVVLDLGRPVFHFDNIAMQEAKRGKHNILVFSYGGYRDGVAVGAWIAYAILTYTNSGFQS